MVEANTPEIVNQMPAEPKKIKDRSIEELEKVATKAMTPSEIKKYVDYLRDTVAAKTAQLNTLKDAFAGAQKQKDAQAQMLQQLSMAANSQIQFCKDTVAQAYKALHYMQPLPDMVGGMN